MSHHGAAVVSGLMLFAAASCMGASDVRPATPSHVPGTPVVYTAIGASETAGVGTKDPLRDAWPRVLWRRTLPAGSTLYSLGVPGSLASDALVDQVPQAVRMAPDVATVWLNVNDLIRGVPAVEFGRTLREIVRRLRGDGSTTVLVANVPHVEELPVYRACASPSGSFIAPSGDAVRCPSVAVGPAPDREEVRDEVAAYNRVTAEVVRAEGAVLVDLHRLAPRPAERPELIAEDGFHPSTQGAEAVAGLFGEALADAQAAAGRPGSAP